MRTHRRHPPAGQYPLVGGFAAWRLPLVGVLAILGAGLGGAWDAALAAAVITLTAAGLERMLVVEISPIALSRGLSMSGRFLGAGRVLAWPAITEITTGWRRHGDCSGLRAVVRGRDGTTITLTSAMGLRTFWALLSEIARRAPQAARLDLTDEVLAEARGCSRRLTVGAGPPAFR